MTMTGLRAAALMAAIMWSWVGSAAAADIATIAKTGDVAPGTGGATFRTFGSPVINGAGEVAFFGALTGPGGGVWIGGPGGLLLVARQGDPAPGTPPGVTFDLAALGIGDPTINGAGEVAFLGFLTGPGVIFGNNETGLWAGRPGGLRLVARGGDRAPGTPAGVVFRFFGFPAINGAGEVAFEGVLTGPGVSPGVNDRGIWIGGPGALRLVARQGARAPGAGGAVFKAFEFTFDDLALNGAGEVAFFASLTGPGVTRARDRGIWAGGPGRLRLVAREGARAPGTTAGVTLGRILGDMIAFNGAGEVAFDARLRGRGVTRLTNEGIWAGGAGRLRLVVRNGARAPGTPAGVTFSGFPLSPAVNGAGEVAFTGALTGRGVTSRNAFGLWAAGADGLRLIAREGARAPGTPSGVTFRELGRPGINGAGEVVTIGAVRGKGVSEANNDGLWTGGPGGLALLAREGSSIEVAPGVFRTVANDGIRGLPSTGIEDGRRSFFGDSGQVVFGAGFTDGSDGIFLSPPDAATVYRMPQRAIDGAWDRIILPRSFTNPVIIAGPPGFRDRAPGVVRLRLIDGAKGHFEGRFQEWRYLNGRHREERADFLVLEAGRHREADGSSWEAGTVDVSGNRSWTRQPFTLPFPGRPQVFVTVQTFQGRTAVAARVRNVTRTGFEVSIQEEERDLASGHPLEDVGYLAVFSRRGRGTIAGGTDGTNYRLSRTSVSHLFRRVLGERIKLEEELSGDRELRHARERVSVMTLGRGLFAQQASDRERDTTAIRRR